MREGSIFDKNDFETNGGIQAGHHHHPDFYSTQLIQSVYSRGNRVELILELDVPRLLSIC